MVKLALLWHMHQPWYADPVSGRFELPWVRIHSIKDYYGMAKLLDEFSGIKATFNLVPSLLKQIELYLEGKKDVFQEIFETKAEKLTQGQASFLANSFFSTSYENHIAPFPRYKYLYKKMSEVGGKDFKGNWRDIYSDNELRDLQVWFSLTNIDQYYRENDKRVKALIKKGENFNEKDKKETTSIEKEIMEKIIPLYRELSEKGRIEISTTPYYHPILPLLIDPQLGRSADPSIPEYKLNFNWKEDAELQVVKGLEYMEQLFGRRPDGIWPSEGSLSEDVIGILEGNRVKWTATDEKIVERSLKNTGGNPDDLAGARLRPWSFRDGNMKIFFRDNYISDLVGFHYKDWGQKDAANDLFRKIEATGDHIENDIVLPVILDGENAWEFYKDSGREFLREFYSLVEKSKKVDMVTFSEAASMKAGNLEEFSAGSWINGNFNIWIGHEDDRRGWELIKIVRDLISDKKSRDQNSGIDENILIAQGSDWFWWYGTENHTEDLETFDLLFRDNLIAACRKNNVPVPDELNMPVFRTELKKEIIKKIPNRYITPEIDGRETSIYEWDGCGEIETGNLASAIYISHPGFNRIKYCFDRENMYFCFDLKDESEKYISGDISLDLEIVSKEIRSTIDLKHKGQETECFFGRVSECRVPFTIFHGAEGDELQIRFNIKKLKEKYSNFPLSGYINIRIPTERDYAKNWVL